MATTKKTTSKRVTKKEALTSCGTRLKPGYKYLKGGGVAKVTPVKKKTAKKGKLGATTCTRQNPDGSTSTYSGHGGSNPCPHGGKPTVRTVSRLTPAGTTFGLGKTKPKRKTTTTKRKTTPKRK